MLRPQAAKEVVKHHGQPHWHHPPHLCENNLAPWVPVWEDSFLSTQASQTACKIFLEQTQLTVFILPVFSFGEVRHENKIQQAPLFIHLLVKTTVSQDNPLSSLSDQTTVADNFFFLNFIA